MERFPQKTSLDQEINAEELWLKSGDKNAFEFLYRQYVKVIFQLGTS